MKIIENPNKEYALQVKKKLAENNGYCPCKIVKTEDTRCVCKEFKDAIKRKEEGECGCGLYIAFK